MTWWDDKAVRWQQLNRRDEYEKDDEYSEREARRAVVYTREDITMIVAYMSALNRQIAHIKILLAALLAVVIYLAIRGHI